MQLDRYYYLIAMVFIIVSFIPFCANFERKRPNARKLVIIAVFTAIAVISRAVFFMIPFFKPMIAVVIISGIGLGWESGFVVGTLSAFVSNFIFGQGPWTIYQMFAIGIIGLLSGLVFSEIYNSKKHRLLVCLFGFLCTVLLYGLIMDTAAVLMYTGTPNLKQLTAAYISGFAVNIIHGIATFMFLFIFQKSMVRKLNRVKIKYKM